jgi:hypothetical protein
MVKMKQKLSTRFEKWYCRDDSDPYIFIELMIELKELEKKIKRLEGKK